MAFFLYLGAAGRLPHGAELKNLEQWRPGSRIYTSDMLSVTILTEARYQQLWSILFSEQMHPPCPTMTTDAQVRNAEH